MGLPKNEICVKKLFGGVTGLEIYFEREDFEIKKL